MTARRGGWRLAVFVAAAAAGSVWHVERPAGDTPVPSSAGGLGRAAVVAAMCDEYGTDVLGVDWCGTDPDDPALVDAVVSACALLADTDPDGVLTADQERSALAAVAARGVSAGDISYGEGMVLVGFWGAVSAVRHMVCVA